VSKEVAERLRNAHGIRVMGLGTAFIKLLSVCPPLGRVALRRYVQSGGRFPESSGWVLESLRRRLVPAESVRTVRLGRGIRLEIDLAARTGNTIYYYGSCEPGVAWFLGRFLKPGMSFIDAGANLGEFTVRAAQLVGPSGVVYAFEASPGTVRLLERNVSLNRFTNVHIIPCALCERDGPVTFYLGTGRGSGSSSLTPPHDYYGDQVTVAGVSLDTLVSRERLEQVDCIKLDIEGAEYDAFRGARNLLSRQRPPLLVFEYHPTVASRSSWDLVEAMRYLSQFGYTLHVLENQRLMPALCHFDLGQCNVVAMPDHLRNKYHN
jgi:FkbM family methyltransferase